MDKFNEKKFKKEVDSIIVMLEKRLIIKLKDGTEKEYIWEYESRSKSWTKEMREEARKRAYKQHGVDKK